MSIIEIDPNQFVIKKRRKLYKFALFANSPICFEFSEWKKHDIDVIEIGAGTGLFSVEMATRHPDKVFLAVDVKADRLQKGAKVATGRGLTNIYFVRARVEDQLVDMINEHSIESFWITFPDPFPKDRSDTRRLTHPQFLALYTKLLQPNGAVYLKHDNPEFFNWSIDQLNQQKWKVVEQTNNLHDSDLPDDYKILTTYEQRWLGEGLKTNFVKAFPNSTN